ncbi:MAG: response regulator [Ginsengibacter sp.]
MKKSESILIVDDSQMIVKTLCFMAKTEGYEVFCAVNGKDAVEFLDGRKIDLVITDLNMPVMDGMALISKIRSSEDYRYVPVVLFIPDDENGRKKMIETSGATMLFDKGNIKEKIIPLIHKILS